ncbi:MAG: YfiR family protein [Bryobacteraceae bacterium]
MAGSSRGDFALRRLSGADDHFEDGAPARTARRAFLSLLLPLRPLLAAGFASPPDTPASLSGSTAPPDPAPLEYRVKAAMLYNFTRFVEWPAAALGDPAAPLVIGIVGENPFGSSLEETVRDKSVWGRRIVVRQFPSLPVAERIQVLFVAKPEHRKFPELLAKLQGRAVLTVSDADGFTAMGGIVGFFTEDNKIRFRVNRAAAAGSSLLISSKLLRLAAIDAPGPDRAVAPKTVEARR